MAGSKPTEDLNGGVLVDPAAEDLLHIAQYAGTPGQYNSRPTSIERLLTLIGAVTPEDLTAIEADIAVLEAAVALLQPLPLDFNFSADGEARFLADVAMTLTEQGTSGTGTVAYEKSTAAAPATFGATASPVTLEAGAWLKVTATDVDTIFAVAMKRTA